MNTSHSRQASGRPSICLGRLRFLAACAAWIALCGNAHAQTTAQLLAQAQKLYDQGNRYQASPLFAKAEQEFRKAGDKRDELFAKFGRLHADADHGNYRSVKAEIERDLAMPLVQRDPELKIEALSVLGTIDLNIDTNAAGAVWKDVLNTAIAAHDLKWENRARGELGIFAGLSGNIGAAGAALFKAIATAERLGDIGGAVNFMVWLANGMAVNGMADGALRELDKATELAKANGYHQLPFELSIARLRAIAMLPEPLRLKRIGEAKRLFTTTLRIAEQEKVFGAEIDLLNQEGQIASKSGDLAQAEQAFLKAASVARSAELTGLEAEAYLQLARVYLRIHQPQKAAASINRGMQEIQGTDEAYDFPLFVAARGDAEAALGHVKVADTAYEHATTLLEGLLVDAPSSMVKSSMVSAFGQIYVAHFRLAWQQLHNGPKAFQIIESARGRVLFDSIRQAQRSSVAGKPSSAEIRIAQLQRSLIHDRLTDSQAKRVLNELDSAYDQLGAKQYSQERKEAAILRQPVTLAALKRLLGPGQLFVEYVLDRQASYALEVSNREMRVHQLPPRKRIAALARNYLIAIKAGRDSRAQAQALYSALIAPLAASGWNSLIIVPDGSLHLIPFEALQDKKGDYLAQRATVSIAPSATVLTTLRREPEGEMSKTFLGVAFSRAGDELLASAKTRGIAELRGANIEPLRYSREEITEADAALGGHGVILDGARASEVALKAEPLSEFKVIDLAAHGFGDELQPNRAAIVLNPGGPLEDGLWQAREIRHTRLNADTVVLSACETGTGRLEGEEGIMNLARAFLTAGAKSVVASLWDVDDRSTATLMEGFYRYLAKGESISQALRSSQMDFIKTYGGKATPYMWAGFEVIGDGTRKIIPATQTRQQATRAHIR